MSRTTSVNYFLLLFDKLLLHGLKFVLIVNQQGGRINLDAQIDNFANTRQEIISKLGEVEVKKLFENAVFSVTIGSNDFINNYLTPYVSKLEQKLVPPESFVGAMIARFKIQLTVNISTSSSFSFYFILFLLLKNVKFIISIIKMY